MDIVYDHDSDLLATHALFAVLEATCLQAGASEVLPYLGMARSEFTDHGRHRPTQLHHVDTTDFDEGVHALSRCLSALIAGSDDLASTLRLRRARDLLAQGTTQHTANAVVRPR